MPGIIERMTLNTEKYIKIQDYHTRVCASLENPKFVSFLLKVDKLTNAAVQNAVSLSLSHKQYLLHVPFSQSIFRPFSLFHYLTFTLSICLYLSSSFCLCLFLFFSPSFSLSLSLQVTAPRWLLYLMWMTSPL